MVLKKFIHKEVVTCSLTGQPIYTNDDDWTAIIDYNGSKAYNTKFYKTKELSQLLNNTKEEVAKILQKQITNQTKEVLAKLGVGQSLPI
jgi:hypothetical protein